MDVIQLKIKEDDQMVKYIKLLRKFDQTLSVGAIKQRIKDDDFVVEFDLEYYDLLDDLNGIDKKESFRSLIAELCNLGAQVMIYQDEEPITLEILDNWLDALKRIDFETERDTQRELGKE